MIVTPVDRVEERDYRGIVTTPFSKTGLIQDTIINCTVNKIIT